MKVEERIPVGFGENLDRQPSFWSSGPPAFQKPGVVVAVRVTQRSRALDFSPRF
jgi:hypothetical protein